MKYLKTFESIATPKYIILKDNYNLERGEQPSKWHNLYGIVVDIAIKNDNTYYYLVRILNKLSKEEIYDFTGHQGFSPGKTLYDTKKEYCDMWVVDEYVEIYNSKEEFDKAVEDIETKKRANKYNL